MAFTLVSYKTRRRAGNIPIQQHEWFHFRFHLFDAAVLICYIVFLALFYTSAWEKEAQGLYLQQHIFGTITAHSTFVSIAGPAGPPQEQRKEIQDGLAQL